MFFRLAKLIRLLIEGHFCFVSQTNYREIAQ